MDRQKLLSGRWVLLIMLGSIALWAIMVYGTLAHLRQIAGGLDPFDMRPFGYGPTQARALLDALGQQGRDFYANVQLRLDAIYPASYALSRGLALWWFTEPGRVRTSPVATIWRIVLLIPSIATAGFDYAENFQIGRMLAAGPDIEASVVETASRMTVLKSMIGAANEICVLIFAIIAGMRWQRRRQP
jgi:hypothetical protein